MSGSSTEPVTEAGKALLELWLSGRTRGVVADSADDFIELVVAIEQEARTSADARADAAEREAKDWRDAATEIWNSWQRGDIDNDYDRWASALDQVPWLLNPENRSILQASAVAPRDSDE